MLRIAQKKKNSILYKSNSSTNIIVLNYAISMDNLTHVSLFVCIFLFFTIVSVPYFVLKHFFFHLQITHLLLTCFDSFAKAKNKKKNLFQKCVRRIDQFAHK